MTKLITIFTLVTKYRSSAPEQQFYPCDRSKVGIFYPCDMVCFNFYPCDKNRTSTPPAHLIYGKAHCSLSHTNTPVIFNVFIYPFIFSKSYDSMKMFIGGFTCKTLRCTMFKVKTKQDLLENGKNQELFFSSTTKLLK